MEPQQINMRYMQIKVKVVMCNTPWEYMYARHQNPVEFNVYLCQSYGILSISDFVAVKARQNQRKTVWAGHWDYVTLTYILLCKEE